MEYHFIILNTKNKATKNGILIQEATQRMYVGKEEKGGYLEEWVRVIGFWVYLQIKFGSLVKLGRGHDAGGDLLWSVSLQMDLAWIKLCSCMEI